MKKYLILLLLFISGIAVQAVETTLNFAHVSDVHLSRYRTTDRPYRLYEESRLIFSDAISQINASENLDFIMFTGDQTDKSDSYDLESFFQYADSLKYPWYLALGNHDVSFGGELSKYDYFKTLRKHNKKYKLMQRFYTFVPKPGYRAIVLDSIINDKKTANGQIDRVQFNWLRLILDTNKEDVVLIFMHHPVKAPVEFGVNEMYKDDHSLLNAAQVETLLKKYKKPVAVFSGHYHVTKIVQDGNILHVSSPALIQYPIAFRLVRITDKENEVDFDIEFKETTLKRIQSKAQSLLPLSANYYGAPCDRSGVFVIKKEPISQTRQKG